MNLPPNGFPYEEIIKSLRECLQSRHDGIGKWLHEDAAREKCFIEQLHIVEGTPERTYWHMGYRCALYDVAQMFEELLKKYASKN